MALKLRESLDTNIILRMILKDVPEQGLKIQDMFMRQDVAFEVADLAITEAVYVLQTWYYWSRRGIVDALLSILEDFSLNYNKPLFERVFSMYLAEPKLSFNDCCLAGYAALNQAEPLWTFDKALAKELGTAKLLA